MLNSPLTWDSGSTVQNRNKLYMSFEKDIYFYDYNGTDIDTRRYGTTVKATTLHQNHNV